MRLLLRMPTALLVAFLCAGSFQTAGAQERLNVLISNDDGYDTPGIQALIRAFQPIANIVVAAPAEQQSGAGHGITYREPLMLRTIHESDSLRWYAISARPATTVRLALEELVNDVPDLVLSGINTSENVGSSTWASGTLGAAREGAISGITSIAVSLQGGGSQGAAEEYDAAAAFVLQIVEDLMQRDMMDMGLFLNVNVPSNPAGGVSGVRLTTASRLAGIQSYQRRTTPGGTVYFWDTWRPKDGDDPGTDVQGLMDRFVTVTPLIVNQTNHSQMSELSFLETQ